MAVPRQLLRPAQTLARVLVPPSFQPAPFNIAARLQTPIALPVTQKRTAVRASFMKGKVKDPRAPTYVVDENIGSIYINLVQEDGTFMPEQRLRDVLHDMDRISSYLLKISAPQKDSEHPYPICRIVSKDELRSMEREKTKKKKTWEDLTKIVEINWSIAKNDLEHQMRRLTQFLDQGLRVEVVLGPKKRGRTATPEEIQGVLAKIKETVASIPSVKEYAESEGEVGRVLTMHFSKPKKSAKELAKELAEKQANEQVAEPGQQADEAAEAGKQAGEVSAPENKAEVEDKSKGPKKVSRYKIKEEEKRQRMAQKAEAVKYTGIQEPPEPQPQRTLDNGPRHESAYEKQQRLMREERQRQEEPRRPWLDARPTQPSATPARRHLGTAQDNPGERFGGRTGLLTDLRNLGSSR